MNATPYPMGLIRDMTKLTFIDWGPRSLGRVVITHPVSEWIWLPPFLQRPSDPLNSLIWRLQCQE